MEENKNFISLNSNCEKTKFILVITETKKNELNNYF